MTAVRAEYDGSHGDVSVIQGELIFGRFILKAHDNFTSERTDRGVPVHAAGM